MWTQIILVASAIITSLVLYVLWERRRNLKKEQFVGFGWTLSWQDGYVFIPIRLFESPSGRAGLQNGSILLEYCGTPMEFKTLDEFIAWTHLWIQPQIGEVRTFKIKDRNGIRDLALTAEIVQGPIPWYEPLPEIDPCERWMYRENMMFCKRTGAIVFTRSLSQEAIDGVLGR